MTPNKTLPLWVINIFFILGLYSATAFRSLLFLEKWNKELIRPIWYSAVTGYIIFFGFRFYIARKRKRSVIQNDLLNKFKSDKLGSDERQEIEYLLKSLTKSREMWNYLFIFVISFIAILIDILHF